MFAVSKTIYDPKLKGAITLHSQLFHYYIFLSQGQLFKRIFKDRLSLDMSGLAFSKRVKYFEIFDIKLQQLFKGGLFQYYNFEIADFTKLKKYEHKLKTDAQILSMKHLEAGFVVCCVSLLFSVFVFIVEWLIRFKDYVLTRCILIAFYSKRYEMMYKPKLKLTSLKTLNWFPPEVQISRSTSNISVLDAEENIINIEDLSLDNESEESLFLDYKNDILM